MDNNRGLVDLNFLTNAGVCNVQPSSAVMAHNSRDVLSNDLKFEVDRSTICNKPIVSNFILPPASEQVMTCEIMQKFLSKKTFNSISVNVSRVAQKSYGSEKRFLCPPPAIFFNLEEYAQLRENVSESEDASENHRILGKVFIKQLPQNSLPLQSCQLNDSQTVKNLFVSDSDHVKEFQVQLKLIYNNHDLGSHFSNDIKVISKPSKKKQTQKSNDLCIESGSKIALFNRLRSQNVNTRYLVGDKEQMSVRASSKIWGIFFIHLVSDEEEDRDEFISLPGNIQYGSSIKLVCAENGISLPRLVIRKVDKQNVFLDCTEVVSQLHKCAFNFGGCFYLSLNHEEIIKSEVTRTSDQHKDTVGDNCIWTIISADSCEVKFYEALGPTMYPISPVPFIRTTQLVSHESLGGGDDSFKLVLNGGNFHPDLAIWFNAVPCQSIFVSQYHIECLVPPVSEFYTNNNHMGNDQFLTVEMFFVRLDGVIYQTGKTFTYNVVDHCFADGVIHPLPFRLSNED